MLRFFVTKVGLKLTFKAPRNTEDLKLEMSSERKKEEEDTYLDTSWNQSSSFFLYFQIYLNIYPA